MNNSYQILLYNSPNLTRCVLKLSAAESLARVRDFARRPLPLSGTCFDAGQLRVRLSGAEAAVLSACAQIGGEIVERDHYWQQLRDHELPTFRTDAEVWRWSLPPGAGTTGTPETARRRRGGGQPDPQGRVAENVPRAGRPAGDRTRGTLHRQCRDGRAGLGTTRTGTHCRTRCRCHARTDPPKPQSAKGPLVRLLTSGSSRVESRQRNATRGIRLGAFTP